MNVNKIRSYAEASGKFKSGTEVTSMERLQAVQEAILDGKHKSVAISYDLESNCVS